MIDLRLIYNAFDADEPLPADDDIRYVDLSHVRGDTKIARKLLQRIKNAPGISSHHLLMGHTKCGKTTELNRTARLLEEEGYATVFFDVAEVATRTFEYTTVLLLMAGQVVDQLGKRSPEAIEVEGASAKKLAEFLLQREITLGGQISGDATGKVEAKFAPGFVTRLLGEFGIGIDLRGGYQRSREITVKVEADTRGFLEAIQELIQDANDQALANGYKGLVVICDGCDKLDISATDEDGRSRDLQLAMFVDHAPDLRSVPCHVIYTVPISIQANLGDNWEQSPEFVPAIPVNKLPGVDDRYAEAGQQALAEVVNRRLRQRGTSVDKLFSNPALLERLIEVSGGHISDLLLLVRDAVLEAQTDGAQALTESHIRRSIRSRAREYTRLIETKYLDILVTIDEFKTTQSNSNEYRELIFKRLALEYSCGTDTRVDLHPLVAASDAYRRYKTPPK
jgi:hypothetical protein